MKFIKNIIIFCVLLFFTSVPTFAETARVEALEDYDTSLNTLSTSFKLLDTITVDNKIILNENNIFYADTYKIKDPKRLKRNAVFVLKIKSYTDINQVNTKTENLYAKYTTELNKREMVKDAALAVGNRVVKGFSIGYKTAEGIVKNKEGKRLKSGVVAAYNASPISCVEKGKDISIKKGDIFLLNFNYIEPDNYSLIDKFVYSVDEED